jgi:predicted nucleotidyltransferase
MKIIEVKRMSSEAIVKTVLSYYPEVEAIYLFGSYLTPDQQQDSDVDLAVLFPHEKAKLFKYLAMSDCRHALEKILKSTVDLINLRTVNTVFQNEIIHQGRIIYQQNEYVVDEFEMQVISSYQKLNEERAGILEDILESGRILR